MRPGTVITLGVLLIVQFAAGTDLDAECVFYGEIAFAPLDTIGVAGLRVAGLSCGGLGFLRAGVEQAFDLVGDLVLDRGRRLGIGLIALVRFALRLGLRLGVE